MKKILKILVVTLLILIIATFFIYILIATNSYYYHNKFDKVKIDDRIKVVVKEWGNPDKQFNYGKDEIVLFYRKDWLKWEKCVFVFNKKDSLLVRKYIGD
jgi:uncharacterized protein YxeA